MLTATEIRRLVAWRRRLGPEPEREFTLDEKRLRFAAWLVQTGRLTEEERE